MTKAEELLSKKGSLEKEFLEVITDDIIAELNSNGVKELMLMSIAHSLSVIADVLSNRNIKESK